MAIDKLGGNSFSTGAIANSLGYAPLGNTSGSITSTLGYVPLGNTSGSITSTLGYTPANKAGDTFTGSVTIPTLATTNTTANNIAHNGWRATLDRLWDNYPTITVLNDTALGPQTEFRIHGSGGVSGGDYSVNLRVDGIVIAGAYSHAAAGYNVMNNGTIIQWGSQSVGPDREVDYNFPTTFPNGCYGFSASGDWHGTTGWMCVGGRPISSSVYRLYNIVENTKSVWWIAVGY